ncbi:glycosyltransferase family 4 protein [Effusibacillus lacus]|uniref:Glycosyl transferase family 1 n=1 Tax=Effusibacillus lacus TaxID=1348429 RepID=A0A292YP06_9BACL|nr:glycosyltransferase family 4 protein [Effusibacillus lacus]TCS75933.1 glycosyltransferase involved in cell wall biosynthesis [Effusibacillus lacus]GAX91678.1 glycosyl transferase family 1 [Effusibacillus lacus]
MMQVAYVSTYVPKKCGLATYTHHLRQSVDHAKVWKGKDPVIALVDEEEQRTVNEDNVWPLLKEHRAAYAKMANKLNYSKVSLVMLQHEFGIFGGEAGSYILDFVRTLKKPLITTFHTIFENPQEPYRSIQEEIAYRSERIIVMNRKAIAYLRNSFDIPEDKIVYIPHGTPVPKPQERDLLRSRMHWTNRKVIMTFGLLSRGKGIEMILEILPEVVRSVPAVLYAIVGQTHPEVKKREGESYRQQLQELIREKKLENHVTFVNRYINEEELIQHIAACDLYVTPYPGMQQITSGTLAYAVGLGRPVLSTPYNYAQDLLGEYQELLIPFDNRSKWLETTTKLLSTPDELKQWERRMERIGKQMRWPLVGSKHALLFARIVELAKERSLEAGGKKVVSVTG